MSTLWFGENRSNRTTPWQVGEIVRYGSGATALMRITSVRVMGDGKPSRSPSAANAWRYSGRGFHDKFHPTRADCASMGWYHGQCVQPSEDDLTTWAAHHDLDDSWTADSFHGRPLIPASQIAVSLQGFTPFKPSQRTGFDPLVEIITRDGNRFTAAASRFDWTASDEEHGRDIVGWKLANG